jgi:hypothetical protein
LFTLRNRLKELNAKASSVTIYSCKPLPRPPPQKKEGGAVLMLKTYKIISCRTTDYCYFSKNIFMIVVAHRKL